jgi:hypothetical protein
LVVPPPHEADAIIDAQREAANRGGLFPLVVLGLNLLLLLEIGRVALLICQPLPDLCHL